MDLQDGSLIELSKLLMQHESDIVQGKQKLSLTASLLQKLNYAIQQIDYDNVSFFQSIAAPNESILYLQQLIHKTPKLTVTQRVKQETWRVDISRFINLRYLELKNIPMHLVEGMHSVHSKLQVLICERCTDCLEEILGTDRVWNELRTAKLCYNSFVLLCPFTNAPWLQYLDLSYNNIEDRLSLLTLNNLTHLNLSFNVLTSVPMLSEELCHKLKVLLINNNCIQELLEISVLDSLEVLDVSNNLLADHLAISPILFLPNLRSINLVCNPISYHPHHRYHTCSYLNKEVVPQEFILDGTPLNVLEQKEIGRRGETLRHVGVKKPRVTCLPQDPLSQRTLVSVRKRNERDVVIEEGGSNQQTTSVVKQTGLSDDHLQTKRQIEEVRERYGGDHWLHSHAGSFVQDLMGLQRPRDSGLATSSPYRQDALPTSSPSLLVVIDKADPTRFDSSASDDFVTALTTQAIIEQVPHHIDMTASDQGQKESSSIDLNQDSSKLTTSSEEVLEKRSSETEVSSEGMSAVDTTPRNEDETEEFEDGQLWLVQSDRGGDTLTELFLVMTEKEIREKRTNTGETTAKWSMESVLSCEKVNNEPPTVRLTFNTIRKSFMERVYVMEYPDAQDLLKRVRECLEARPLSAMHQVAYRCMKCSSMFSVEIHPSVISGTTLSNGVSESISVVKCSTCGSTLVVQLDEPPLPSGAGETSTPQGFLHQSPSECSIGSAASLEQGLETEPQGSGTKEGTPTPRRYDSDIEIISNPSQSSIEVLEVQARLQGSLTPYRKRSNEERSLVAVPQLNTVLEVQTSLVGLTESSSSGSLTDSVCTACEVNTLPVQRVGMCDVPEEVTSPPPNITYTSPNQALCQNEPPKVTEIIESVFSHTVQFYIKNVGEVDHRLMLYLYQNTFKDDKEELLLFLRGPTVTSEEAGPKYVVVSTLSVYILHIVAPEIGDDVSEWLQCHHRFPLTHLDTVYKLPWHMGVGVKIREIFYMTLFYDPNHACHFIKCFNSVLQDIQCLKHLSVTETLLPKTEQKLQKLISCSVIASSGPVDTSIRHLALCSPVLTTKNSEKVLRLPLSALLITTTDLLLLGPDWSWLLPSNNRLHSVATQRLENIIEVDLKGLQLQLHYLKEHENEEEIWSLRLANLEAVKTVVEHIRGPWEQLYSIPLQLDNN